MWRATGEAAKSPIWVVGNSSAAASSPSGAGIRGEVSGGECEDGRPGWSVSVRHDHRPLLVIDVPTLKSPSDNRSRRRKGCGFRYWRISVRVMYLPQPANADDAVIVDWPVKMVSTAMMPGRNFVEMSSESALGASFSSSISGSRPVPMIPTDGLPEVIPDDIDDLNNPPLLLSGRNRARRSSAGQPRIPKIRCA